LFRLDRGRQGGVRVHPGAQYLQLTQSSEAAPAGERLQDGLLPVDAEAVAVQDARLAPEHPPTAPEPLPVEAEGTPAPRDAEDASPASSSEVTSTDGTDSPAEPAPAPRAAGRKRTAARTAPRAKKTAPAIAPAKKKPARPRAKKA
jgi:hypothetical protein